MSLRYQNRAICGLAAMVVAAGSAGCKLGPRGDSPPLTSMDSNPGAGVRGDLQVWAWNIAAKSLQRLAPDFRKRYPSVRVNVDMTGANLQARFLLSLSAGVGAPDVSQLQMTDAPKYMATHRLTDLTAVADRYEKDFPASRWRNCVLNRRVYAIPWDIGPCGVYYKRELFRRYGVDAETIETWDDYIAAGKEILAKSGGKTKMLALSPGALAQFLEILMQQNGGQIFDDEGRIAINSPQAEEALGVIRRMFEAGICSNVTWWQQEWLAGLKDESIATYPLAVWFGGTIKDTVKDFAGANREWRVMRLPALAKGGLRTSNLGGSVLVIPDQCRQKQAAWAFIQYALCTVEGQIQQYKSMDLFPAYLPALRDPYIDAADPFFGGQHAARLFSQDITRIPAMNRTPDWTEATRYLDQTLSAWLAGGMKERQLFATIELKLARRLSRPIAPTSLARTGSR